MASPTIAVVGSSNTDMIIELDRIPRRGETLLGGDLKTAAGGKGANQAVAAARAGARVALIARIGADSLGDRALAGFTADGIDVSCITRDARAPSGAALIFVDRQGANCIAVALGANNRLSAVDIRKARFIIGGAKAVLMQLETPLPTVALATRMAAKGGALVILNPAPARELPDALLRHVTILTPNETEAEVLSGIKQTGVPAAKRAAEKLRTRGARTVVLTLGERGALIADSNGTRIVKGNRVKVRDTTAAGDVFNGALVVALTEGQRLDAAVRFANAAAALSVMQFGAQPSAPSRRQIDRFIRMRQGARR
jgi:ribokinase